MTLGNSLGGGGIGCLESLAIKYCSLATYFKSGMCCFTCNIARTLTVYVKTKWENKMSNFNYNDASATFIKALGNGKVALSQLDGIMQAVAGDRNSGHIMNLIERVEKKGDSVAAGVIRFVAGQVFKGAKITKAKGGQKVIKIAGIEPDQAVLVSLSKAVHDGLSIRSNKLRSTLMGAKPETPDFDPKKRGAGIAKPLSVDELQALIAALSVELNAKKAPKI